MKLIPTSLVVAAVFAASAACATEVPELFNSKACVGCHSVDNKVLGPALREVAAKYAGKTDAVATIVKSIKDGSTGQWGPIPMAPNPVTDDEAKTLAEWILTLK
ncbi:c-type cytochrome [Pelistega europaea]|uniref:C-type cytochrome n=1 Tax=Pelistega europaea TaxID=106147 RepID=A0A7Y4P5G7_9BURK|nr:c-type cytochrome [Pelistega europaea]NOL49783.1 c-type cytochrome [Pelistega europaea]